MIPRAQVTAWRAVAPWPLDAQVEQDLVLSRALVELFRRPGMEQAIAFRGGTALHKLILPRPGRYSEDIDLVQFGAGPIGPVMDEVRAALDPWLGQPGRKQTPDGATLVYRFESTSLPVQSMRLKVEINTREHGSHAPTRVQRFVVDNPWFMGAAPIVTYSNEELLGTKLRALYQRKKGRDLFDLSQALSSLQLDDRAIVEMFGRYVSGEGARISRAQFERNLAQKEQMPDFLGDILPLLPSGSRYDAGAAMRMVRSRLIVLLPGKPWRAPEGE